MTRLLNRIQSIRAIRILCYANELMLVCHVESQIFQGRRRVRYLLFMASSYIVISNHIDKESINRTKCQLLSDACVVRN